MPAASEINACCPTSLTLLKQPEDSADGFNGLLLFTFITAQICHVNTNFFKLIQRRHLAATNKTWSRDLEVGENISRLVISLGYYIFQCHQIYAEAEQRRTSNASVMKGDSAWLAGDLLFPSLMSTGSVGCVQKRKVTLVWVKGHPSLLFALFS